MTKKDYSKWSKEELVSRVGELEKRKKYGLVWDEEKGAEQFEIESKEKLPVLAEVKEKKIETDEINPVNILMEGDNYHALSVLNYTHRGKIDVIYIDPPYNTGSENFVYNDNRYNNVEQEDPYKHSKWLGFMSRRLRLAKELLNNNGTIFISIDDNEIAQIKLLCDEIFGEGSFITAIPRISSYQRSGQENYMNVSHDYILCYSYASDFNNNVQREISEEDIIKKDKIGTYISGDTKAILAALSQGYSKGGDYDFEYNGKVYKPITKEGKRNRWLWTKERMKVAAELGILVETKNGLRMQIYLDKRFEEGTNKMVNKDNRLIFHTADFMSNQKYTNVYGTNTLGNILGKNKFNNPKPVDLIIKLIDFSENKNAIVLDFFAGSGTTGHAVLELNKEDGGNRKFILCTNNENNICTEVCYPRIKKVIEGYKTPSGKKVEGFGGNLKYFRTDFVDAEPTDANKIKLTKHAIEMLCLKEDTFEKVTEKEKFKIFRNGDKYTGIILDHRGIKDFKKVIKGIKGDFSIYIFSVGDDTFDEEFEDLEQKFKLSPIPEVILRVYRRIFNKI